MPLRVFVPTMLRVQWVDPSDNVSTHPLHDILRPLLLTPRSSSQKYHERINQALENDSNPEGEEERMMWLAFKNAKGDEELETQTQDPNAAVSVYDAEEAWKERWLAKMEQREVQIQILLHFLVLSLPGAPPLTTEEPRPELPTHLSPSKKKRRRSRKEATPPPPLSLEAYLELFMDKFSMWQLVATVNGQDTERKRAKGKQKAVDERDWMQVFCEDVVEPRFRSKLPHLCNLLRTKIFPSEPFPGEPDSPLSTPPASPRPAPKRLKTSASSQPASTSRHSASASRRKQPIEDSHALQRARSRSLSVSLEKERARSQSAGVSQKKRTIAREVSMKTAFKGKAQAQARAQRDRESAAARVKDGERGLEAQRVKEAGAGAEKARRAAGAKGVTLVAATPVKAKERGGRSQAQASDVDDARLPKCELERVVEGEENGEDWMLSSSPDVLLLGSNAMPPQRGKPAMNAGVVESDDDDEEEDVLSWMGKNAHLALMDTPTKPKNARR